MPAALRKAHLAERYSVLYSRRAARAVLLATMPDDADAGSNRMRV